MIVRIWLALSVMLYAGAAGAQTRIGNLLINAEKMDRDFANRVVTVSGRVQIIFGEQHFSCDKAVIYERDSRLVAEGNVMLTTLDQTVEAARIEYDFKNNTGVFHRAFVQSGQVTFEGSTIEKLGDREYAATDAVYTACETCPPAWSFSGKTIEARLGGYADIKYPVLRFGNVPILILPRILVPLKSDRQSGFLVPRWGGSDRGGFDITQSYFWAISRSEDATLSLKSYRNLGLKGLVNYRYLLSPTSRGEWSFATMRDRAFEFQKDDFKPRGRWYTTYSHYYDLPEGYVQRVQLNLVSDLRYTRDFPKEIAGQGDSALENRLSVTKRWQDSLFVTEVDYYLNLLSEDPLAGNDSATHRFPEIRYHLKDTNLFGTNLLVGLDAQYVNFTRESFGWDEPFDTSVCPASEPLRSICLSKQGLVKDRGLITPADCESTTSPSARAQCLADLAALDFDLDGSFDPERDIIRTGQRMDLRPTLAYPLQAGAVSVLPRLTYRETFYRFQPRADSSDFSNSTSQRALEADLTFRLPISRVYGEAESNSSRHKHILEPFLTFSTIPWLQTSGHPFFAASADQSSDQADAPLSQNDISGGNGIQFDYQDRLYDKRLVEFGLSNRLTRKSWVDGQPRYLTVANVKVFQNYDLIEAQTDAGEPWSSLKGQFDLRSDRLQLRSDVEHFGYAKITNSTSRLRYSFTPINFSELTYTQQRIVDDANNVVSGSRVENYAVGVGANRRYFEVIGSLEYSVVTQDLLRWSFRGAIKPPGNCWRIALDAGQAAGGKFEFEWDISFNFGGESGVL